MPRVSKQDPLQGFNYRVSIPGIPQGCGFKKISGLSLELGVVSYDEGGYKNTHKLKGKKKTGELVCEKGLFPNKDIEDYFKSMLMDDNFRSTITIELLAPDDTVARKWSLSECWASKWEVGEFDASSEDVVVETITIQYEDFI